MSLAKKIQCNGALLKKSEVYAVAAELTQTEGYKTYAETVLSALDSFAGFKLPEHIDRYYDHYYDYYHDYYCYCYNNDSYSQFTASEKVLALLFLSAMYSSQGH